MRQRKWSEVQPAVRIGSVDVGFKEDETVRRVRPECQLDASQIRMIGTDAHFSGQAGVRAPQYRLVRGQELA